MTFARIIRRLCVPIALAWLALAALTNASVPLLEKVDFPVVTNGDPRLLAVARERGWPMLQLFEPAHA